MGNEFEKAQADVKNLKSRPSDQELLSLYALYKQATQSDVTGKRPGAFSFKERAKYDAWAALKGLNGDMAQSKYIALVSEMVKKYS